MDIEPPDSEYVDACEESTSSDFSQIEEQLAVRIVEFEGTKLKINEEKLKKILLQPKLQDKHVVVLSIAGKPRKGKSFLLNHCLNFLEQTDHSPNWLEKYSKSAKLRGFAWSPGSKSCTTGIVLWPEPLLVRGPEGEEVAVILMDTQGISSKNQMTEIDCKVCAFSVFLSSIQVFNLMDDIDDSDLQYLSYIIDYASQVKEKSTSFKSCFQKLVLLIRDWRWNSDHSYGFNGGNDVLEEWLNESAQVNSNQNKMRTFINESFKQKQCFLMPFPGKKVAKSIVFNGAISDYNSEFREHMPAFVSALLSPKDLIVKKIAGQKLTCQELFGWFETCAQFFNDPSLPEPMGYYELAINFRIVLTMDKAVQEVVLDFRNRIENLYEDSSIEPDKFDTSVKTQMERSMWNLEKRLEDIDPKDRQKWYQLLETEMEAHVKLSTEVNRRRYEARFSQKVRRAAIHCANSIHSFGSKIYSITLGIVQSINEYFRVASNALSLTMLILTLLMWHFAAFIALNPIFMILELIDYAFFNRITTIINWINFSLFVIRSVWGCCHEEVGVHNQSFEVNVFQTIGSSVKKVGKVAMDAVKAVGNFIVRLFITTLEECNEFLPLEREREVTEREERERRNNAIPFPLQEFE